MITINDFSIVTYAKISLALGTKIFGFSSENAPAAVRRVPAVVAGQGRAIASLVIIIVIA